MNCKYTYLRQRANRLVKFWESRLFIYDVFYLCTMNTAYLILGSNIGDKRQNLNNAMRLIEEHAGSIERVSEIYVTAAWGNTNQPDFLNQALLIETPLGAIELLETLLRIEQRLGSLYLYQIRIRYLLLIASSSFFNILLKSVNIVIQVNKQIRFW